MRLIASSLLAGVLALSAAAPAFADPPRYDRHDNRGNDRHNNKYDKKHDKRHDSRRDDRHDNRYDYRDARRDNRYDYRDARRDSRYDNHHWKRGDRFDRNYHHGRYVVVNDYRNYRLPPPRYGEYYARTDSGDIILIAAATGLILWALSQ